MQNLVFSLGALAHRTYLPVEWLRKQVDAGTIPCLQVGRRRVFSLDAVEAALDEMAGRPDVLRDTLREHLRQRSASRSIGGKELISKDLTDPSERTDGHE
jgi:hypothetical protein